MSEIDPHHLALAEAILFASSEPTGEKALANRLPEGVDVKALLEELRGHYAGRGVNLVRAGKTWSFRTNPEIAAQLVKETKVARRLGRATVEVLAIVAYHQPVTRAEIEEIRGVSLSSGTMETLLEEGWIKPRGRRRTPGRPMTWGTTDTFLDNFGLEDIGELPGVADLKAAGLLNSGPAIETYRVTGTVADAVKTAEEGEETGENAEEGTVVSILADGGAVVPLSSKEEEPSEKEGPEQAREDAGADPWPRPETGPHTAA